MEKLPKQALSKKRDHNFLSILPIVCFDLLKNIKTLALMLTMYSVQTKGKSEKQSFVRLQISLAFGGKRKACERLFLPSVLVNLIPTVASTDKFFRSPYLLAVILNLRWRGSRVLYPSPESIMQSAR